MQRDILECCCKCLLSILTSTPYDSPANIDHIFLLYTCGTFHADSNNFLNRVGLNLQLPVCDNQAAHAHIDPVA